MLRHRLGDDATCARSTSSVQENLADRASTALRRPDGRERARQPRRLLLVGLADSPCSSVAATAAHSRRRQQRAVDHLGLDARRACRPARSPSSRDSSAIAASTLPAAVDPGGDRVALADRFAHHVLERLVGGGGDGGRQRAAERRVRGAGGLEQHAEAQSGPAAALPPPRRARRSAPRHWPRTETGAAAGCRRRGWSAPSARPASPAPRRTAAAPAPAASASGSVARRLADRRVERRRRRARSSGSVSNTRFAILAAAALVKVMQRMLPGIDAVEQEADHPLRQHMGLARAGIGRDPGGDARDRTPRPAAARTVSGMMRGAHSPRPRRRPPPVLRPFLDAGEVVVGAVAVLPHRQHQRAIGLSPRPRTGATSSASFASAWSAWLSASPSLNSIGAAFAGRLAALERDIDEFGDRARRRRCREIRRRAGSRLPASVAAQCRCAPACRSAPPRSCSRGWRSCRRASRSMRSARAAQRETALAERDRDLAADLGAQIGDASRGARVSQAGEPARDALEARPPERARLRIVVERGEMRCGRCSISSASGSAGSVGGEGLRELADRAVDDDAAVGCARAAVSTAIERAQPENVLGIDGVGIAQPVLDLGDRQSVSAAPRAAASAPAACMRAMRAGPVERCAPRRDSVAPRRARLAPALFAGDGGEPLQEARGHRRRAAELGRSGVRIDLARAEHLREVVRRQADAPLRQVEAELHAASAG